MRFAGPALIAFVVLLGSNVLALAQDANGPAGQDRPQGGAMTVISPIFSQLVALSLPDGFVAVFEQAQGPNYIRESVPEGEGVDNWRQMITVTGAKDFATRKDGTPKAFFESIAGGFKRACPTSFNQQVFAKSPISGFDAIVAVLSCGLSPGTGGSTSESALFVVIKGQADLYTIQWAERTAPSAAPLPIDKSLWAARLEALAPIRLCPIVAGEKAPFPSCIGSRGEQP